MAQSGWAGHPHKSLDRNALRQLGRASKWHGRLRALRLNSKALRIIKQLLLEMQAYIDNEKEVRRDIYEIFKDESLRKKLLADPRFAAFAGLRLPGKSSGETGEGDAAGTPWPIRQRL